MEERFETFDETGTKIGLVPRSEVHREGFWHRAANIFVFLPDGKLVIQRRQLTKDVCPGVWDVSAAEHLQPGETFEECALRGLQEELGIVNVALEPYGEVVKARYTNTALGIHDHEFQQSFKTTYDGPMELDPEEVLEVRIVELAALQAEMEATPDNFTPWFLRRASELQLFKI